MPERTHGWKVREREASGSSSISKWDCAPGPFRRIGANRSSVINGSDR